MFDQKQLLVALTQISEEKGIPREKVVETVEMAIAAAYKKEYGKKSQNIRASFDPESGDLKFFQVKLVVDETMLKKEEPEKEGESEDGGEKEPETKEGEKSAKNKKTQKEIEEEYLSKEELKKIRFNPERHIMVEEAQKENPKLKSGDEYVFELPYHEEYGRIASQTAKQVVLQRLKEAEREAIISEYQSKIGEIVSGVVQRIEGRTIYFDVGKATGALFPYDQIPQEFYQIGNRMRLFLVSVELTPKGPVLVLSRSHPRFISKLFEMEVPEILDGIVIIKSIAREAGSRTKIAVFTEQEGVDPIGSCVGQKGTRVAAVINELGGEKIDIIEWSENISKFISNALAPAKVSGVVLVEGRSEARVMVLKDQLSLAIGKGGQNVRLAARLCGWKIDVRSVEKPDENTESAAVDENGVEAEEKEVEEQKESLKKNNKKQKSEKEEK